MDIGDKSWGVTVCQKYFEKQSQNSGGSSKLQFGPENTLHVGDQFLSAGANDFRARSVGTTAWIASPEETVYVYCPPPPPAPSFYGQQSRQEPHISIPCPFQGVPLHSPALGSSRNCRPILQSCHLWLTIHHSDLLDELGDLMYKKLT